MDDWDDLDLVFLRAKGEASNKWVVEAAEIQGEDSLNKWGG